MIQDLSGSWYIKGTDECIARVESPVPLLHHDPDISCITDLDPDHPKGTQPKILESIKHIFCGFCSVNVGYRFTSVYPPPHSLDIRECIVCQHQAIVLQSGCSDSSILYSWIQRDTGEVMLCPTLTMRSLSVPL